jgi:nicotinate dehydrogenase subunit B
MRSARQDREVDRGGRPVTSVAGPVAAAPLPKHLQTNPLLSRWVQVDDDGVVHVRVGKVELGQGITTALAQIAADELAVPLEQVRMQSAHTAAGPDEGLTAGSMSIVESGPAVRLACANVRGLFTAEAVRRLGDDEVRCEDGRFVSSSGRSCTYADLADAVDLDVDARPDMPTRTEHEASFVGTSAARVDLPDKVTGRPRFLSDLRLPGQLFGRVVRPPSVGARLLEVEGAFVGEGVEVVRDGSFLGALGGDEAEVARAVERLRGLARWEERESLPDEDDLVSFLQAGPHETTRVVDEDAAGEVERRVGARWSRPFLAHASMAPSCGVAVWEDGGLRVWSHSQGVFRLRDAIAQALAMDVADVVVEHVEHAGCYGHNGADDAAFDAVLLARAVPGKPVQVLWSRRDELAWSPFGSAMVVEAEAGLDAHGRIVTWSSDVWSQGHTTRPGYAGTPGLLAAGHLATPVEVPAPDDPPLTAGAGTARNAVPIYEVGSRRIAAHRLLETPIRSSALRSLGAFTNVLAIESLMDELADEVGADPVQFRLAHLGDDRAREVLQVAASAAGWGGPVEEGHGRGVGLARYKGRGAWCAVVADVEAESEIRLHRLTVAVDVGRVVNPDGVRNQIEGGAVQAASWTLRERVRFDRKRITSDDWESYPILRFGEVPDVEVHLVDRPPEPSLGAGEAAQGPTAGAIANAVAAAVGVRVRDLPITAQAVVAAIESA